MSYKTFFSTRALHFRRLTHKAYAAFASMHREVTIGRLSYSLCDSEMLKQGKSVALCLLTFASSAWGQSAYPPDTVADADPLILQEVQVTASAQLSSTAQPVTVIHREQLQSLPIHSVADVFRQLSGLDIRQRGPTGVQADVSIRGCTADQTLIFLNGINLTDPQTGHYSMNLPLTGDEIERVEVYASTATAIGAYAGVVNIVTRRQDNDRTGATLSLRGGEYGLFAPSAAVFHKKGNLQSTTSAGYNQSTGFTDNTDYRIASAFTHLTYKQLQWQAGVQYKDAGANAFYALAYPKQFDATRMAFTSVSLNQPLTAHWSLLADASYRCHFDRFELFRHGTETPEWYTNHNHHTTHTGNIDARVAYRTSWGTTTVGVTAHDAYITSNTLGEHNRFTFNYFLQQTVTFGKWSATLLAGGVYNNVFRSDWTVSADVNYRPTRRWLVYANASRALRLPNYTELYYQSKTQVADSKLQPEHAVKAEIGAEYKYQSWNVGVAAFYRYGTNTIDWIKYLDSEDERWFSRQLTNLHTVGGSLTAAFCPQKPASGFLKQLRLHYTYMYMDKPHKVSQGEFLSKYALDHLSHHASLTLDHVIYRSVGACWQLTVQDRHGSYLNRDGNVADYHTVWLLGGKVYYDHHLFSLSLECTNMLNRLYYDIGGIEQPRHWVSASVVVHL